MERKLTAILCADVYGYSRLMNEDEEATLHTLSSYRKIIDGLIARHYGRFVNSAGDSVLAEFASVVEAVKSAVEIQAALKSENANLPPQCRMEFRIGVNSGDVMVEGDQIYGDGVNVAARLENLADPGGICISGSVYEQVRDKLDLKYQDRGEQAVKNIARPLHLWRVVLDGTSAPALLPRRYWRGGVLSLMGIAMAVAAFVVVQHLSFKPPHTSVSIPPIEKSRLTVPTIPSIAVLPFANLSGDPQQDYFSDGITDDLITDLARLPNLFVIARSSSFAYKAKAERVQKIGKELGVNYLLDGSIRKAANQVRINVQLVNANTGTQLWTARYDRELRDIFKVQDELVRSLVTTLGLQLPLLEKGFVFHQRTTNLEAYDWYLRGVEQFYNAETQDDFADSANMMKNAIAFDRNYADAYAALGFIHKLQYEWYLGDIHELDIAEKLERKAIMLDNTESLGYAVLGQIADDRGRSDQAIADERRAIALAPSDSYPYVALSGTLDGKGRLEEALTYVQKAMRLDPASAHFYSDEAGSLYNKMGRYEEALASLIAGDADDPWVHVNLIYTYSELGREENARAEAREVLRLSPGFALGDVYGRSPEYWNTAFGRHFLDDLLRAGLK